MSGKIEQMQSEQLEQRYLSKVEEKMDRRLKELEGHIEKWKKNIKEQKEFIWENTSDMDREEFLENKQSVELDTMLLDFDIKNKQMLERSIDSPYFGKVQFKFEETGEKKPVYIGLMGFHPDNEEWPLIFDWRAPISSLYYEHEKGPGGYLAPEGRINGKILEKKQFQIKKQKMQYMLDTDLRIDDDVLRRELGEHAEGKMRQVAATIQKEQNEIIRNNTAKTLIINGCAGSGKTVVALHRVAWLLYNRRKYLKSDHVLILSPNALFSDYISQVLPELGENNVPEKEWDDLMADLLMLEDSYEYKNDQVHVILSCDNPEDNRMKRISYKSSISYFNQLNVFLKGRKKDNKSNQTVSVYMEFLNEIGKKHPEMKEYRNEQGEICYEDVLAVFYLQIKLYGCGCYRGIKHLVVDEMQDYSIFQYAILKELFDCPKTILGDVNQTLIPEQDVIYALTELFPESTFLEMKKSYRCTDEITRFSNQIIGGKDILPFERHGKEPVVIRSDNKEQQKQKVKEILQKLIQNKENEEQTIAVLCDDEEECMRLYDELKNEMKISLVRETTTVYKEGISILPKYLAKGLEFDVAVVYNTEDKPENRISRYAFYIACTRALHELYVLHIGGLDVYL